MSGESMEESGGRPTKRDMIGTVKSSVQRILSDLSMTRVCVRWVPFYSK